MTICDLSCGEAMSLRVGLGLGKFRIGFGLW